MDKEKNLWKRFKLAFATATVGSVAVGISRCVCKMVMAGIIINIIADSFYPELPSRFPIIYGLCDGCLQFGEFLFRLVIRVIYLIVTLKWGKLFLELGAATTEFGALLAQLSNWIASIHF